MQVEELKDGVTNLMLRGRLDTVGTEAIKGPFNAVADTKRAIVVDLSQVTFLTSWGIRMLVLGAKVVTNKGGKIVLSSPNGWVQFVLETAEIDQFIPVLFDRSAAIAAVAQEPS
jgi:stage II sporulation protein AA (anti-sigma F factor antagonist)